MSFIAFKPHYRLNFLMNSIKSLSLLSFVKPTFYSSATILNNQKLVSRNSTIQRIASSPGGGLELGVKG